MASRDHVAILLYALDQRYDPVPEHVVRLALADIATSGFDPAGRVELPASLAGQEWRGRTVAAGEPTPVAEASYFEHVLLRAEWPEETTLAAYLRSLRDVLLDGGSGAFIARYQGAARIGAVRRSGTLRGPGGGDWIVLSFDPETRHWVAGWQPEDGLAAIAGGDWSDVSWLRIPR